MESLSRWKIKKINADVPLYDPDKKTYMVLIEDDIVELPEEVFLKLFKRIEVPNDKDWGSEESQEEPETLLSQMGGLRDKMKAALRFYNSIGMDRGSIMKLLKEQAVSKSLYSEKFFPIVEKEINAMFDEIEREGKK